MSRHSAHTVAARTRTLAGVVTDLGEIEASLNLDESQSPYGIATLTCPIIEDETVLSRTDPRANRGLRLTVEMRESVGDPVRLYEVTADYGGSVAAITAAYGPALTPAKLTAMYFSAWNDTEVRPGAAIRADLVVTSRDIDHEAGTMTFIGKTDEALAQAYRLVATIAETSGATSVRATVNYALAKLGAVLTPGADDATVVEASAIVWEPGVTAWDYMRGVAEAAGLVVRCDERRRWTLTRRDATLDTELSFTAHTSARERVDLDSELTADAVVVVYDWTDPTTGNRFTKYETASARSDPITVIRVDRDTPYPGPGAARYWLNRYRARGRVFDLEHVGDYRIRPGMPFTASLPYTTAQLGYVEAITWRQPEDLGEVRTRGAADAAANAIDLWPEGYKIDDAPVGLKINDAILGV